MILFCMIDRTNEKMKLNILLRNLPSQIACVNKMILFFIQIKIWKTITYINDYYFRNEFLNYGK